MNPETLYYMNIALGVGTILLQALSVLALLLLATKKQNFILDFIKDKYLLLGFLVAIVATLASMFYSNVVGFVPCVLCWYQRVFLFPMVFLFGVAIFKADNGVLKYVTPLAVLGFLISLYQNYFYYFGGDASALPCDASGVSCYQRIISEFGGYISFPMMSLTTFLALLVIFAVAYRYKRDVSGNS